MFGDLARIWGMNFKKHQEGRCSHQPKMDLLKQYIDEFLE